MRSIHTTAHSIIFPRRARCEIKRNIHTLAEMSMGIYAPNGWPHVTVSVCVRAFDLITSACRSEKALRNRISYRRFVDRNVFDEERKKNHHRRKMVYSFVLLSIPQGMERNTSTMLL